MNLQLTLDFLADLAKNNQKEWMDSNRKRYVDAKGEVIELVTQLIKDISAFAPEYTGLDPRKTLFRINRDIRFSKNKDPYKTNFGASIVPGGKKTGNPGFYVHLMPGNSFVGGGIYQPASDVLQKVRQEIDYNGKDLLKIIEDPAFKKIYGRPFQEDKLKTAPRGYSADHEHIDLLQLKHYVFMFPASDKEVLQADFSKLVVDSFQILHPFNQFLSRAMD